METEATFYDGGCACGQLRFRMASKPMFIHCCHCTWCQRQTGTAFALNALIEEDRVTVLHGDIEIIQTPSPSGKGQRITRCPQCRVAVWSNYGAVGDMSDMIHFIRVGTLDNPNHLPPDVHIYTVSKQPWVVLPPNIPSVSKFYNDSELWPQDSLDRRAILFAKNQKSPSKQSEKSEMTNVG